jgi:hypothetical protein
VFGNTITKCKILWGILENAVPVGIPDSEMPPLVCYRVLREKD